MSTTTRAKARNEGLRIAARIAGIGGIALLVVGGIGRQAHAEDTREAAEVEDGDDENTPLGEIATGTTKAESRGGNCGCSPCWGPPAPPQRSFAECPS